MIFDRENIIIRPSPLNVCTVQVRWISSIVLEGNEDALLEVLPWHGRQYKNDSSCSDYGNDQTIFFDDHMRFLHKRSPSLDHGGARAKKGLCLFFL